MTNPATRLRMLAARIERRLRTALSPSRTVYVAQRVNEYREYWSQGAAIVGARLTDLLPGVWEIERRGRRTRIANYVTQCDDPVTLQIAGDKPYGYALANAAGVPVPPHRMVTPNTTDEAFDFFATVGGPLVVKPAAGSSSGLGISMGIRSAGELRSALTLASLFDQRILVEQMIVGESYRILYLAGRAIHAVRRRGVRVTGDGRRPVRDLLNASDAASLRSSAEVAQTLQRQNVTMDAVPTNGRDVLVIGLRAQAGVTRELRTVYDESVLRLCGEEMLEDGAALVRALGSEFAGVDLITTDPSVSLRASGGAFIEINTTPGIHHHYITDADRQPMPVAAQVIEYLLERTRD